MKFGHAIAITENTDDIDYSAEPEAWWIHAVNAFDYMAGFPDATSGWQVLPGIKHGAVQVRQDNPKQTWVIFRNDDAIREYARTMWEEHGDRYFREYADMSVDQLRRTIAVDHVSIANVKDKFNAGNYTAIRIR